MRAASYTGILALILTLSVACGGGSQPQNEQGTPADNAGGGSSAAADKSA
jgi:hypothetical protein